MLGHVEQNEIGLTDAHLLLEAAGGNGGRSGVGTPAEGSGPPGHGREGQDPGQTGRVGRATQGTQGFRGHGQELLPGSPRQEVGPRPEAGSTDSRPGEVRLWGNDRDGQDRQEVDHPGRVTVSGRAEPGAARGGHCPARSNAQGRKAAGECPGSSATRAGGLPGR